MRCVEHIARSAQLLLRKDFLEKLAEKALTDCLVFHMKGSSFGKRCIAKMSPATAGLRRAFRLVKQDNEIYPCAYAASEELLEKETANAFLWPRA